MRAALVLVLLVSQLVGLRPVRGEQVDGAVQELAPSLHRTDRETACLEARRTIELSLQAPRAWHGHCDNDEDYFVGQQAGEWVEDGAAERWWVTGSVRFLDESGERRDAVWTVELDYPEGEQVIAEVLAFDAR